MYSGGIAIDTISTRMQGGASLRASFFGHETARPSLQALWRANLYAGHGIAARGRFPYLFTNLNVHNAASSYAKERGATGLGGQLACIVASTTVGAAVITVIEGPKIMRQLAASNAAAGSATIVSITREHGPLRLLRGYDACLCRELFFNVALLGSPAIAAVASARLIEPAAAASEARKLAGGEAGVAGRCARLLEGKVMLATSFVMGLAVGFLTNGPDQLKTRIQHGQFGSLPEALRWQLRHGGGIRSLYGQAAVYRALYTAHGVLALNFARHNVEHLVDQLM